MAMLRNVNSHFEATSVDFHETFAYEGCGDPGREEEEKGRRGESRPHRADGSGMVFFMKELRRTEGGEGWGTTPNTIELCTPASRQDRKHSQISRTCYLRRLGIPQINDRK